jgi:hypothetical protein
MGVTGIFGNDQFDPVPQVAKVLGNLHNMPNRCISLNSIAEHTENAEDRELAV